MPSDDKYTVTLTGAQVDDALMQMNQRIPEGWAAGTRDGVAVSSTSQFYHNNAKYLATQAKSWAQGGTGERSGEDTNNAQYWAQQAQAAAGGGVSSFKGRTGAVQPQSGDYTAAMVGAMPADADIPTKVSDLVNDQDFVTQIELDAHYVIAGKASGVTVGGNATSEGLNTSATGTGSHAEGVQTTASGVASHAEGVATEASGDYSHAEGAGVASGDYSHAEGNGVASEEFSHAEGNAQATGVSAHAENAGIASGENSHAEGASSASGEMSHSEGYGLASGKASHAEGDNSKAQGDYSHSEGSSKALGNYSHAEGRSTVSEDLGSHSEGYRTVAAGRSQHVFGECNVIDRPATAGNKGVYIEIVGNGTSQNARSNARTLDWNGNEVLAGKLTVGAAPTANMDVATKKYVDDAIAAAIAALQNS